MSIDQRLAELGITPPEAAAPVAAYVPVVQSGNLLFVSGQVSFAADGSRITGRLGEDMDLEAGQEAARRCGLMVLAQVKLALGGSLDRVSRIVKVLGMVNAVPGFGDQPKVINGCSDVFVEVFGEAGRHARTAIGLPSLYSGMTIEIEAVTAMCAAKK